MTGLGNEKGRSRDADEEGSDGRRRDGDRGVDSVGRRRESRGSDGGGGGGERDWDQKRCNLAASAAEKIDGGEKKDWEMGWEKEKEKIDGGEKKDWEMGWEKEKEHLRKEFAALIESEREREREVQSLLCRLKSEMKAQKRDLELEKEREVVNLCRLKSEMEGLIATQKRDLELERERRKREVVNLCRLIATQKIEMETQIEMWMERPESQGSVNPPPAAAVNPIIPRPEVAMYENFQDFVQVYAYENVALKLTEFNQLIKFLHHYPSTEIPEHPQMTPVSSSSQVLDHHWDASTVFVPNGTSLAENKNILLAAVFIGHHYGGF